MPDNAPSAPNIPPERAARFVRDNTRPLRPPLVPEIVLHLAEESLPIWRRTEEELNEQGVPPPYWAFAWAGGQALARYLLDNPAHVRDRTVLDIGTGSGLVAIAAARAGARRVIANDIDRFALEACRINAAANGVVIEISGADLLLAGPGAPAALPPCDVAVLADVFYERALAEAAMTTAETLSDAGTTVLAGDPCRSYFPAGRFRRLADYRVPVTRELEDNQIKATAVWSLVAGTRR